LLALARQFAKGGTEELENPYIFSAPEVRKAGGLEALKMLGEPKDIITETKERLFAV
jgi:type I restriction enzyme R subunit